MEFGDNWLFNSPAEQVNSIQLHKHCNLPDFIPNCNLPDIILKMKFLPPPIKLSSLVRRLVALPNFAPKIVSGSEIFSQLPPIWPVRMGTNGKLDKY